MVIEMFSQKHKITVTWTAALLQKPWCALEAPLTLPAIFLCSPQLLPPFPGSAAQMEVPHSLLHKQLCDVC